MADVKNMLLDCGIMPAGSPAFANHTVDANNDGIGFSFQARSVAPITHVGFRYGARTGTPPVFVATLEGFSATTGNPDGADVGGGSPTAVTFTPPADATWDGTWQWITLTNAYTPSVGQFLTFTIRYSSGTIDASNLSTFTTHATNLIGTTNQRQFPGAHRLTAGTWAKSNNTAIYGIRTASTRYGFPATGFYATRSASTVGHRQALKFTLPAGSGDTFKVRGVRFAGAIANAAGKNPVFGLWDGSGVIQNVTLDSDWVNNPSSSYTGYDVWFDESSLTALSFGTAYYLGLQVADAANGGVIINGLQLDNASDLDAYPGGSEFHFSTFDGSNWSDDTTVRPMVSLILDDITEPAGGGGGLILPRSLNGGLV